MEELIPFIIFIAIALIAGLFGRKKGTAASVKTPRSTSKELLQKEFQKKIERYLQAKQPPPLPQQQPQPVQLSRTKLTRASLKPSEKIEARQPEVKKEPPGKFLKPEKPLLDATPAPEERSPALLSFIRRQGYVQGIIMAELLAPPVSKRKQRRP